MDISNFLTFAKLIGLTVRLFDKTLATPTKHCWLCEKEQPHHIISKGELYFAICDACHLTQPVGPGCTFIVERGGPTAVEMLIQTARQNSPNSQSSIEIKGKPIDMPLALKALSAMCSTRHIFKEKAPQFSWTSFEYLCLLIAYRNAEEALKLALLCKNSKDGQGVSELWQQWQSGILEAGFSNTVMKPLSLPESRVGKLTHLILRETDEHQLSKIVLTAVTSDAGWLMLFDMVLAGFYKTIVQPIATK